MNLIDLLKNQLPADLAGKLGGLVGGNEQQAKTGILAAIPLILAALAKLVSSPEGAKRAAFELDKIDPSDLGDLGGMLPQSPKPAPAPGQTGGGSGGGLVGKGGEILGSLLGEGMMASIASAIAKFTGLSPESAKKLLASIAPFILGAIAKETKGKPGGAQGLSDYFGQQVPSITGALPAGLSLADIPGLGAAQQAAGPLLMVLVPLLGVAVVAVILFFAFGESKPDVPKLTAQTKRGLTSLTESLEGIKDLGTADAVFGQLTALEKQFAGVVKVWDKIPAEGKAALSNLVKEHLGTLTDLVARVHAIPDVKTYLGTLLEVILKHLEVMKG